MEHDRVAYDEAWDEAWQDRPEGTDWQGQAGPARPSASPAPANRRSSNPAPNRSSSPAASRSAWPEAHPTARISGQPAPARSVPPPAGEVPPPSQFRRATPPVAPRRSTPPVAGRRSTPPVAPRHPTPPVAARIDEERTVALLEPEPPARPRKSGVFVAFGATMGALGVTVGGTALFAGVVVAAALWAPSRGPVPADGVPAQVAARPTGAAPTSAAPTSAAQQAPAGRPVASAPGVPVAPAVGARRPATTAPAAPAGSGREVASAPAGAEVVTGGQDGPVVVEQAGRRTRTMGGSAPVADASAPSPAAAPVATDPDAAMDGLLNDLGSDRPQAGSDGWFDTIAQVGQTVAGLVSGGSPGEAVAPGTGLTPTAPAPSSQLLSGDDPDLRLSAAPAAPQRSAADLATDALLAELDGPMPMEPGRPTMRAAAAAPVEAPAGQAAPEAAAAPAPAFAPGGSADESDGSWFDTVTQVGQTVASFVTGGSADPGGAVAPGTPGGFSSGPAATFDQGSMAGSPSEAPGRRVDLLAGEEAQRIEGADPNDGWNTAAAADDPTRALLAELDGPMPMTAGAPTMRATAARGGVPAGDAVADPADRGAAPGSVSDAVAPGTSGWSGQSAASDAGWFDTVVSVGNTVATMVGGGGEAVAPGTSATFDVGGSTWSTSEAGGQRVDLLAGEEGLRVADTDRRDGWNTAAAADDPTRALLAELDGPMPMHAGAPTMRATAARPAAPTAAAADDGVAAAEPPMAFEREERVASAPAPGGWSSPSPSGAAPGTASAGGVAPAAAPGASSWYDTVQSVGTTVASFVSGGSATFDAPAAGGPVVWSSEAPSGQRTDLLAGDDGANLRVGRPDTNDGWNTAARADDPTMALLAELDGPMPMSAGRPTMRPGAPAAAPGGAPVAGAPSAFTAPGDDALAMVDPGVPGGAAPVVWQTAAPGGGWTDAPAAFAQSAANSFFWTTNPSAAPPAPRPCYAGELCGDDQLPLWRDGDLQEQDLLAQADDFVSVTSNAPSVAELFYTPGDEELYNPEVGGLDSLKTILVTITTDLEGVPVEIDGKAVGRAPLVAELTPGPHAVRLYAVPEAASVYTLSAWNDPDEWCFELRGRAMKNVTCR